MCKLYQTSKCICYIYTIYKFYVHIYDICMCHIFISIIYNFLYICRYIEYKQYDEYMLHNMYLHIHTFTCHMYIYAYIKKFWLIMCVYIKLCDPLILY